MDSKVEKFSAAQLKVLESMYQGAKLERHVGWGGGSDWYTLDCRRSGVVREGKKDYEKVNGNTINSLEERGLIKWNSRPVGTFSVTYFLTAKGHSIVEKMFKTEGV